MASDASTTLVKVPSGWLITMQEDGRYVPFFVKVREKDLVWSETIPEEISDAIGIYNEGTLVNPKSYVISEINGWECKFYGDLTCELKKEIFIDKFFQLTNFDSVLTGTIKLPVKINSKKGFFPCVVSSCLQDELLSANVSVKKDITIKGDSGSDGEIIVTDEYTETFKLILSNQVYRFHKNFSEMGSYTGSSFYVTIRGILYTGIDQTA